MYMEFKLDQILKEEIQNFKLLINSIQWEISNPPKIQGRKYAMYRKLPFRALIGDKGLEFRDLLKRINSTLCLLCSELGPK